MGSMFETRFSRSGESNPFGKLTAEFPKVKAPEDTFDAAQRMAREAGLPLSEWLREVIMLRVHGIEVVRSLYLARLDVVAGTRSEKGKKGGRG